MENLIKKLEEQITFLQQEISNFNKRIEELDSGIESSINKEDKKPPHY